MKVHGTSAVLLGIHVLLFSQNVGESKKVRFFYFNMICSPRGFRNSEFQILTNQKSTNQMIASEILDKYKKSETMLLKADENIEILKCNSSQPNKYL